MQNPETHIPSKSELVSEYEAFYAEKLDRWDNTLKNDFHVSILRAVYKDFPHPDSILDVGCGTGVTLQYLRKEFPSAHPAGIDLSSIAIEEAKHRLPGADLRAAFLGEADFGRKFSLVITLGTLEHFHDPVAGLRLLANEMQDNGFLYIEVPNCIGYDTSEKVEGFRRLNRSSRQVEWHLFRPTWEKHIQDAGLHIAASVTGPMQYMEFIWLVTKKPVYLPQDAMSSIRNIEVRTAAKIRRSKLTLKVKKTLRKIIGPGIYKAMVGLYRRIAR